MPDADRPSESFVIRQFASEEWDRWRIRLFGLMGRLCGASMERDGKETADALNAIDAHLELVRRTRPAPTPPAADRRVLSDEELHELYRSHHTPDEYGRAVEAAVLAKVDDERDALRQRVEELTGAIETLVCDEIISAGRARELHGMKPEQQRAHWRERIRGGEDAKAAHAALSRLAALGQEEKT
jgi:hypothetical protein